MNHLLLLPSFLFFTFKPLHSQTFLAKTQEAGLSVISKTEGVAVADFDLDNDLDIYFVSRPRYDSTDATTWNRLFENNGDGTFSDKTLNAGLHARTSFHKKSVTYQYGVSWGDFDNDGYPDLYLTNNGADELYRNEKNGTFTNVSDIIEGAKQFEEVSTSAAWWDYDLDGDLDVYVSVISGMNKMYENIDGEFFKDVSNLSGLADNGATWVSLPIDANNDGLLDLYVVNEAGNNSFYVNQGNKTFLEATTEFGLDDGGDGMGVACGDFNNDGFFDIYVTNLTGTVISNETNPLFVNTGTGRFVNRAAEMGIEIAGIGWGTEFFDYDHDGYEDLYVSCGMDPKNNSNYFFKNLNGNSFLNISAQSGAVEDQASRGLVIFDYDNDNDLDILVSNIKSMPSLYANQTPIQNWLKVKLIGKFSNRSGFGSVLEVEANGQKYYRYQNGIEYLGQSIQPIHLGLGNAQIVNKITVRWPNGEENIVENASANQTIIIAESQNPTSVQESFEIKNDGFKLIGNYPNPFNRSTVIAFELFEGGDVELLVTDLLGRTIQRFKRQFMSSGGQQIMWNGTDEVGNQVSSGLYFYRISFKSAVQIGKIMYIK